MRHYAIVDSSRLTPYPPVRRELSFKNDGADRALLRRVWKRIEADALGPTAIAIHPGRAFRRKIVGLHG